MRFVILVNNSLYFIFIFAESYVGVGQVTSSGHEDDSSAINALDGWLGIWDPPLCFVSQPGAQPFWTVGFGGALRKIKAVILMGLLDWPGIKS